MPILKPQIRLESSMRQYFISKLNRGCWLCFAFTSVAVVLEGFTALVLAAKERRSDVCLKLIERGANWNIPMLCSTHVETMQVVVFLLGYLGENE